MSSKSETLKVLYNAKIKEVMKTEEDWNGYGSSSPNDLARDLACFVLDCILEFGKIGPWRIVPSAEEGIGLSYDWNTGYAYIECLNDGDIVAAMTDMQKYDEEKPEGESFKQLSRVKIIVFEDSDLEEQTFRVLKILDKFKEESYGTGE